MDSLHVVITVVSPPTFVGAEMTLVQQGTSRMLFIDMAF